MIIWIFLVFIGLGSSQKDIYYVTNVNGTEDTTASNVKPEKSTAAQGNQASAVTKETLLSSNTTTSPFKNETNNTNANSTVMFTTTPSSSKTAFTESSKNNTETARSESVTQQSTTKQYLNGSTTTTSPSYNSTVANNNGTSNYSRGDEYYDDNYPDQDNSTNNSPQNSTKPSSPRPHRPRPHKHRYGYDCDNHHDDPEHHRRCRSRRWIWAMASCIAFFFILGISILLCRLCLGICLCTAIANKASHQQRVNPYQQRNLYTTDALYIPPVPMCSMQPALAPYPIPGRTYHVRPGTF